MGDQFHWSPSGEGYECSSRYDKRFSAFYAKMPDGRTIEQHYQCDVKGYDVGGTNWRLGKGKPPLHDISEEELLRAYVQLWREWTWTHRKEMLELYYRASHFGGCLTDAFATTRVNQAHALSILLNEIFMAREDDPFRMFDMVVAEIKHFDRWPEMDAAQRREAFEVEQRLFGEEKNKRLLSFPA